MDNHDVNRKRQFEQIESENINCKRILTSNRLSKEFFQVDCKELAKSLLGKILVRKLNNNNILKGRIVETESYLAEVDKASHSYNGRRTERNEPMYMEAGTVYVYMTYGMYYCFNISSLEPGAAVLIRALEPLEGLESMKETRFKGKPVPKYFKNKILCNGPSKLCLSLNINKENCNKLNLADETNNILWIEDDLSCEEKNIVNTSRIGIESVGGEWAKMFLRYYIFGNDCVSKCDKDAEKDFM